MLGNLKVGQKILVIEAVVAIALIVLLLVSYASFVELRQRLDEVKNQSVPDAIIAKDMQMQVVQIQQWLTDISATRGQDGLDDGFKEAEKAHAIFLDDLAKLRQSYASHNDAAGVDQADKLKARMADWYATGKKMARAYIDGGAPAGNQLMGDFDKISTDLQEVLRPVIEAQVVKAGREIDSAVGETKEVQWVTLAGIAAAIGALAAGGVLLTRGIATPLNHMSALMTDLVSRKDFSVRLDVTGTDEIAQASQSFNELVATLRAVLQELADDVRNLDDTAAALADAVSQSSESSSSTSQAAASMAAAVEQMSVSLDQMRDNTGIAQDIVMASSQHSEKGGHIIDTAVADMQKISTAVGQVADVIGTLDAQTSRISNVVDVIREVADQTNLLALNAAIEAARAGEQGRGFAVVADEVRKLAERTAQATGEIASTIKAIQDSAHTAVGRMDGAVQEANAGAQLAQNAGHSISAIREGVGRVDAAFREIANSIAEQATAGQLIAQQVEQVARATDGNTSAVGHTADAAHTLESLSRSIRERIEQFKT